MRRRRVGPPSPIPDHAKVLTSPTAWDRRAASAKILLGIRARELGLPQGALEKPR